MCIAIVTTAHPDYPLIILNNRDEYLGRPTAPAAWWPSPDTHILGGRDLHRPEHGTWLGVTKQGRLAVLTNFKEVETESGSLITGRNSRGAMVNAYLRTEKERSETSEDVARKLVDEGLSGVGGFSLMFGKLRKPAWKAAESERSLESGWKGLCVVSNRSKNMEDVHWLCAEPGETHALSNSLYGDHSWPKVLHGERLVQEAVDASQLPTDQEAAKKALVSQLLEILSQDTLPKQEAGEPWEKYLMKLRTSIFIPPIGKDRDGFMTPDANVPISIGDSGLQLPVSSVWDPAVSGRYGTQKQTIILVNWEGKITYFERTLFDKFGKPFPPGERDLEYEFDIEEWSR